MRKAIASFLIFGATLWGGVAVPFGGRAAALAQRDPQPRKEAAKVKEVAREKPSKGELGPMAVFSDIEDGWQSESVDKILRHFGKGKVAISIQGTGPAGGDFSKNQSHYLFKDLFKYTITEKFEFVQYRNVSDGKQRVYAVADRAYKRNDDGRTFKDRIYVALEQESGQWVISEIKSVR